MAKYNYSYIKHQKELAQKKKREETRQRRQDRKNAKIKDNIEQAPDKDIPVV